MNVDIHPSWKQKLASEFQKEYFNTLANQVRKEYQENVCYPLAKDIFAALNDCPFDKVKVVILGQDPYHGENQANGLCFSVKEGVAHPPSLTNIFKELSSDLDFPYPKSGDLSPWSKQGVLLLNSVLTVRANEPASHQHIGWEQFTNTVIKLVSSNAQNIVFLLWGGYAKKKIKWIAKEKHCVLTSGHPSPLSANRGYWFGNEHFSKANAFLQEHDKAPIDWQLK